MKLLTIPFLALSLVKRVLTMILKFASIPSLSFRALTSRIGFKRKGITTKKTYSNPMNKARPTKSFLKRILNGLKLTRFKKSLKRCKMRVYINALEFEDGRTGFEVPKGFKFVRKCPDRFANEYWRTPFNYLTKLWMR